MTDPQEMIAAITNLEQELRDPGWQPAEMVKEHTGIPFTRWFPPEPPPVDREFLMDHTAFTPNFENGPHPLGEDY